jgi:hypothetical protein
MSQNELNIIFQNDIGSDIAKSTLEKTKLNKKTINDRKAIKTRNTKTFLI